MRPAMIVLGLAVLILVVFVTIGLLSSQSPVPVKVGGAPSAVPGTTLRAESAAGLLAPIVEAGEPPTNVRNAVFVPVGVATPLAPGQQRRRGRRLRLAGGLPLR